MRKTTKKQRKQRRLLLVLLLFFLLVIIGKILTREVRITPSATKEEFYETYAPLARSLGRKYDLFPSVILAQAAVESAYGTSALTVEHNNFFGIKGRGTTLPTKEVEGGQTVRKHQEFASYKTPKDSFKAYGKLVGTADRYENVRKARTPEEAAQALHPCGYSTNPNYGNLLIKIIQRDGLKKYD